MVVFQVLFGNYKSKHIEHQISRGNGIRGVQNYTEEAKAISTKLDPPGPRLKTANLKSISRLKQKKPVNNTKISVHILVHVTITNLAFSLFIRFSL